MGSHHEPGALGRLTARGPAPDSRPSTVEYSQTPEVPVVHRPLALLCALLLAGCPTSAPEPVDDDDSAPGATATATLGPDGGSVSLPDGTTFALAAGAVPEDLEITITEAAPEGTPWDDEGYAMVRVGTPFVVEPAIRFREPFTVSVPATQLPAGRDPTDVVLVVSSDGVGEGHSFIDPESDDPPGPRRIHPTWRAVGEQDGAALFQGLAVSTSTVYQPMVVGEVPDVSGEAWTWTLLNTQLGQPCSSAVAAAGVAAPVGIDDHVQVDTSLLLALATDNFVDLPGHHRGAFLASLDRYIARACYATWATKMLYRDDMDIDVFPTTWSGSPMAVPISIAWYHWNSDGTCNTSPGNASGNGVTMYFNYACEDPYKGWTTGGFTAGYNQPEVAPETIATMEDHLEATLAHELFHYAEDWANGTPGDNIWGVETLGDPGYNVFPEGGANTGSEEAYDDVPGNCSLPTALWNGGFWQMSYETHTFWRWLDWEQDVPARDASPMARILGMVKQRVDDAGWCPWCDAERITPDDLDQALEDMFPSRPGYDLEAAFADFALAMLWKHEFERSTPSDAAFDRYPDLVGKTLEEEGPDLLWGLWGALDPTRLTVTDPAARDATPANNAALTMEVVDIEVASWGARAVTIDLSGLDASPGAPAVRLSLTASDMSGALQSHLGLRLARPDNGEAKTLWQEDGVSTDDDAPTAVVIGPADFAPDLALVLANTGDVDLFANLSIEEVDQMGLVLASFDGGVTGLDLGTPGAVPFCDDPDSNLTLGETYRAAVARVEAPVDGVAIAYPYGDEVRLFDRAACAQVDTVTLDPGPGPVAMDLTPDGQHLVLGLADPTDSCAAGGVAVVELASGDVVADVALPHGAGDLVVLEGLDGPEALVTQPGDDVDCFSSFLRYVPLDDLLLAGLDAPTDLVVDVPVGGTGVNGPSQMTRTDDRAWAAWVTSREYGRVALLDVYSHQPVVFDPTDPVWGPWGTPMDLDMVVNPVDGHLRIIFVNLWDIIDGDDPWMTCEDGLGDCSAAYWIDYDPATGEVELSGERTLPWSMVNRIAITPDRRTMYVTYTNRSIVGAFDLGANLDGFLPHVTTPWFDGEPWPIDLWMP